MKTRAPLFLAAPQFFLSSAFFALHSAISALSHWLNVQFWTTFALQVWMSSSITSLRNSWEEGDISSSIARNCIICPLAFWRPGMEASQSDVRAAFINEDQFPCIECLGLFSPSCTHLFLLFACLQCLFLTRPVQTLDRTAYRSRTDLHSLSGFPNLTMFCQRRIGVSIEEIRCGLTRIKGRQCLIGERWDENSVVWR